MTRKSVRMRTLHLLRYESQDENSHREPDNNIFQRLQQSCRQLGNQFTGDSFRLSRADWLRGIILCLRCALCENDQHASGDSSSFAEHSKHIYR